MTDLVRNSNNSISITYRMGQLYMQMTDSFIEHIIIQVRLKNKMPAKIRKELIEQEKIIKIRLGLLEETRKILKFSTTILSEKVNYVSELNKLINDYNESFRAPQILERYSHLTQTNLDSLKFKNDLDLEADNYANRLNQNYEEFYRKLDFSDHLANLKGVSFRQNYAYAVHKISEYFGTNNLTIVNLFSEKINIEGPIKSLSFAKIKQLCSPKWVLTSNDIQVESWNVLVVADALLQNPIFVNEKADFNEQMLDSVSLSKKEMQEIIQFTNLLKANAFEYTNSMIQIKKYELLSLFAKQFKETAYRELVISNRILVVGTMSSGKSTVLNSLMGQDLFPSKNEACTAKLFEYTFTNKSHFTMKEDYSDIVKTYESLTPEIVEQYNNSSSMSKIRIEGPSKAAVTINKKLTFVDTPGPNNSSDNSHRKTMKQALHGDYDKILYILNSTQLSTTDDMHLLHDIHETVRKNPTIPVYFIVNKVDEFDNNSNENIEILRQNVHKYLQEQGFESPTILFVSALTAKLVQNEINNQPMSRKERTQLRIFYDMMLDEDYNLSQYTVHGNEKIANPIQFNENLTDEQKKLLIHSGITEILSYL